MSATLSRRTFLSLGATVPFAGTLSRLLPAVVVLPSGASSFVSVPPSRLADTRPEQGVGGFTDLGGNTIRVQIAGRGGVPANASTAVLNVTVVNTSLAGYVTVYPAGMARPLASNVNIERKGQVIPNLVTARLGASGAVDIYTQNPADIVVDVNGAYAPVSDAVSAGRFVGLESAFRVLDTRDLGAKVALGETRRVSVAAVVPATASAVVVNLTVTESNGPGFWTGFPAGGTQPDSSSVNTDAANQTRANQAILPIGTVGGVRGIDVFSSSGGHLIVDVAGYFSGPTDAADVTGLFVPNAPYRTLDTRELPIGRLYAGWIVEFDYAGRAQSQAVVVNLTATQTRRAGYFTGYPARTVRPLASNLNATTFNQTIANHAILRTSTAGVAIYTQGGAHLVVDVAGYFIGQPAQAVLPPPINIVPPPPPPAALPYILDIPKISRTGTVLEGVAKNIVDNGFIGHWPGTGFAGEQSHMVLFAHRTEHGGFFRYLDQVAPGDEITLTSDDGRVFHYRCDRRDLTGNTATAIYNVGLQSPLPSVSLVACSRTNFLPTDVRFRLIVTFSLFAVDGE